MERMAGFEPAPQGLEGPQAAVTPHSPCRHSSVVKEPALTSWWAARDSNPRALRRENGVTARQRTIRTYRPNEADSTHVPVVSRHNLLATWPTLLRGLEAKTKKAFWGIAPEGLVHDECRAFRALDSLRGYRACRAQTRRRPRSGANNSASPSTSPSI